jgi:hypothetical protein
VVMIAQPKTGVIGECGNWQGFALIHILWYHWFKSPKRCECWAKMTKGNHMDAADPNERNRDLIWRRMSKVDFPVQKRFIQLNVDAFTDLECLNNPPQALT